MTDEDKVCEINARIPGWSDMRQYSFFKDVLRDKHIGSILVVGVYHGRDIAYILRILADDHPGRTVRIVGVDRFLDAPCADWSKDMLDQGCWKRALGGFPAPVFESAKANTASPMVEIIQSDDEKYLAETQESFDVVYLDTAHDYATVKRQLGQVRRVCDVLICGDDYAHMPMWGVVQAVGESFFSYCVHSNHVWHSEIVNLK
jgi:hypothetical protein